MGNTPLQTEGKLELRCAGTVWYVQDTVASSELMGHKVAGDETGGVTGEVKEGMDHLGVQSFSSKMVIPQCHIS